MIGFKKTKIMITVACSLALSGQSQAFPVIQTSFGAIDSYQSCISVLDSAISQASSVPGFNGATTLSQVNTACAAIYGSQPAQQTVQQSFADQQSRQVVRQISSMISSRISSNINPSFSVPTMDTPKGASADNNWMPDSVWSNAAWSRLSSNGSSNGVYNADIYQSVTGVDKNIGKLYFGSTVNYAGTNDHIQSAGLYGSNHTVGITPYAAYAFNKSFFISGLWGYNYSTSSFRGAAPQSELDSYVTEFDLNALHVIGNWFMKGKTGARYLHSHSKTDASLGAVSSQSNQDSWTYLIDVEGGYAFANGLRPYTGILYENLSPASVTQNGITFNAGNNIFYYSAGADYAVNKKFTLGAKVQTDLNNSYSNLTTIGLNARLLLD